MAKEFKEWDKKFSASQIYECQKEYLGNMAGSNSNMITKWIYADQIRTWSNEEIRHAVYFEDGAEDWQLFRVSMKGLTTKEKLYMLGVRRDEYVNDETAGSLSFVLERCRIDNYIGALRRGGQLNEKYEVVK